MNVNSEVRKIDCLEVDRWQLIHADSYCYQPFRVVDTRVVQHGRWSLVKVRWEQTGRQKGSVDVETLGPLSY
jgi:hypothetical protein